MKETYTGKLPPEKTDTKSSKDATLRDGGEGATIYVRFIESVTAAMDKMERVVEGSPRLEREGTGNIFLQELVKMQEMDEKAPVDTGVQQEAQEGVLLRGVRCIHDGGR